MRRLRLRAFRRGAAGISATAKLALLIGLLLTLLVAGIVFAQGRSSAKALAELQASDLADSLSQRVGLAQAYLRAAAGRQRASEMPTSEQFDSFVSSLGPQPIANAIIWLPRVDAGDRAAFERFFLGGEGATIRDLRGGGDVVSAGSRPLYQPVAYLAGDEAFAFLKGVDFLTHAGFRAGLDRATELGLASLTPVARVGERRFVVLLLPVHSSAAADNGSRSVVGAVLEIDALLSTRRVQRAMPAAVRIRDITDEDQPRLLVSTNQSAFDGPRSAVSAELAVGGRRWLVEVPPSYADAYEFALLVMLGGLVLSGLIALLADRGHHLLVADDLQREVDRQTAALQRSTAEFRALFEEGGAGKCELVPGSGHFRRVNLRLCELLAYERAELERMTFRAVLVEGGGAPPDSAFEELLRGERDSYFGERRFCTSAGEELWGELSATVLRDARGRPVWIVAVVQDVTARKQAEEARQLLVRELAHRVKNTLQLARSLADQTARYVADLPSFMILYQSRLRALATAHDQLFKTSWAGADLRDLVAATLDPYASEVGDRLVIDVPSQILSSAETQTVALLVNELATNASKHGALSNDLGHITIRARVEPLPSNESGRTEQLIFEWEEDAGQSVDRPSKRGFGMTFLTRAVAHQHDGEAEVDWRSRGVAYRFVIPLHPAEEDQTDVAA